jgi:hypothetical protein
MRWAFRRGVACAAFLSFQSCSTGRTPSCSKQRKLGAIVQMLKAAWDQLPDRQTAVDKVLRLKTANNAHGKTVWHQYTDGALVGRPIPPNQWLHVTQGIRAWDGLLLQFTVLSNSFDSPEYMQGQDIALSGVRETPRA